MTHSFLPFAEAVNFSSKLFALSLSLLHLVLHRSKSISKVLLFTPKRFKLLTFLNSMKISGCASALIVSDGQ